MIFILHIFMINCYNISIYMKYIHDVRFLGSTSIIPYHFGMNMYCTGIMLIPWYVWGFRRPIFLSSEWSTEQGLERAAGMAQESAGYTLSWEPERRTGLAPEQSPSLVHTCLQSICILNNHNTSYWGIYIDKTKQCEPWVKILCLFNHTEFVFLRFE